MLDQMQALATKVEEAAERASRGSFQSCINNAEDVINPQPSTAAAELDASTKPLSTANLKAHERSRSPSPQVRQHAVPELALPQQQQDHKLAWPVGS